MGQLCLVPPRGPVRKAEALAEDVDPGRDRKWWRAYNRCRLKVYLERSTDVPELRED